MGDDVKRVVWVGWRGIAVGVSTYAAWQHWWVPMGLALLVGIYFDVWGRWAAQ